MDRAQKIINWLKPKVIHVVLTEYSLYSNRYLFCDTEMHYNNLNDYIEDRFGLIDDRTIIDIVANFKTIRPSTIWFILTE